MGAQPQLPLRMSAGSFRWMGGWSCMGAQPQLPLRMSAGSFR